MKTSKEVARLAAVKYDQDTDEVSVVFRVIDPAYKSFVLQVARREDISFSISGERLYVEGESDAVVRI